ncbi:DUF1146 domain-containing protein [bacterium]|nr:DUF1146 domain-containing protein [bacterium]
MKMENIMNYKVYLYVFFTMLSAFALSGVNFNKFLKKDRYFEARILAIILSMVLGYLLTNFVCEFF